MRPILLAVFALLSLAADAQAQSRLNGRVFEIFSGRPLRCLNVHLMDAAGLVRDSAETSRNGGFEFVVPDSSLYRVRIFSGTLTDETTELDRSPVGTAFDREYRVPLYFDPAAHRADTSSFIRARPNSPGPFYPDDLRSRRIEGNTWLTFVVEPNGLVDTSSAFVLDASHAGFAVSVLQALPTFRFIPFNPTPNRDCPRVIQQFIFNIAP